MILKERVAAQTKEDAEQLTLQACSPAAAAQGALNNLFRLVLPSNPDSMASVDNGRLLLLQSQSHAAESHMR
eukprot:4124290-Amphidinium_carterae.1